MRRRDPIKDLRAACKEMGSQKAFAERYGLSDAYVSDVLNGRRDPGDGLLRALGLRRVVTYYPTECGCDVTRPSSQPRRT